MSWQVEWPHYKGILFWGLGVEQDFNPYMWQMVFINAPVEGWIIYTHENSIFNCKGEVLALHPHYAKVGNSCRVTCDVIIAINRGGSLKMFLKHLSKSSCRLTNVFFITLNPCTLVSVDHPTLLCDGISNFGDHKVVLDGSTSLEMYLHPMSVTDLHTHTEPFCVRYSHVGVVPLW